MTAVLDAVIIGTDASPGASMVRLADTGHQAWVAGVRLEQPWYVSKLVNQCMQ